MKKIIKLISFVFMFIMMMTVTANAEVKTEVDYRTGNVTVTGQAERQGNATVKVYKPESTTEYAYFDQVKVDQYGGYEITFNTDGEFGPYKMVVNNGTQKVNEDIYFDIFVPKFSVVGAVSNMELENLSELEEGEGVKAILTVAHNPEQSTIEKFDAQMLCAVYNEDGKLLASKKSDKLEPKNVNNGTSEYEAELAFTPVEMAGAAMMKLFLWENGTLKPYTGVYKLDKHPYGENLKILSIGNSFSNNSTVYINKMAEQIGIKNFTVGYVYVGGATLQGYAEYYGDNPVPYYKNSGDGWEQSDISTSAAIADEEWDIIFIQQGSIVSGDITSYKDEYINKILTKINTNKTNDKAKIGWHMTWPYATNYNQTGNNWETLYGKDPATMFKMISACVKEKILTDERFSYVLHSGTAIWNARNCTEFVGEVGEMSGDGQHVYGYGSVIAGMAWLRSLGYDISAITTDAAPDLSITPRQLELMKSAVNKACESPYMLSKID